MGDIATRWAKVHERVAAACRRVGRSPDGVRVVAVTKTFGPEHVREAMACGLRIFGESRVQEAAAKIPLCPSGAEWHFVGHLQRNKAYRAVELFSVIHSVDSVRLLEAVERAAAAHGKTVHVCLEVNVAAERSKFGVRPEEASALLERANACPHIAVIGLMTIPPFHPDPEKARPYFRCLREWRDSLRKSTGTPLEELSMGMSADFEVAVEEGATLVRLGTCLFGARKAPWRPGEERTE